VVTAPSNRCGNASRIIFHDSIINTSPIKKGRGLAAP
jgi:hypothetical protein